MNDIQQLEHDLKNVRNQIGGIYKELSNYKEIETKLDRVITLLEGDPIEPGKGFIPRLIIIEQFVANFNRMKSYYTGSVTAVIFIAGFFGTLIMGLVKLYELIFKK